MPKISPLASFTFFSPNGQIYMFQTKNVRCVYYGKTKKARPIIFGIGTFYIHMSTHTKNQPPSHIGCFWPYGQ